MNKLFLYNYFTYPQYNLFYKEIQFVFNSKDKWCPAWPIPIPRERGNFLEILEYKE